MKTLLDKERNSTLSVAYNEITRDRQNVNIMTTRFAARGEITSVYAASNVGIPW